MKSNNKGQSLIEILLAMGLMAILLPALSVGLVATLEGKPQRENRTHATALVREAEEALKSMKESSWNSVKTSGLYHPEILGTNWTLVSGTEVIDSAYSRQILIEDIQRDNNYNIVTSGGTLDPSTKKATITVSWTQPRSDYVQSIIYLTRFNNNTSLQHTTEPDFNAGEQNNTRTATTGDGAIELKPGSGSATHTDEYVTNSNYVFDNTKIEVTGGVAKLKALGGGTNVTANKDFDPSAGTWSFITFGDTPAPVGSYQPGGNPGQYGRISFSQQRNKIMSGYWTQPIAISVTSPTATLSFDWRVVSYQATPDSFHVYVYIDSTNGTPTNLVWDSGNLVSTTNWSSVIGLDVSSYLTTPGTYYLKIGAYVDYPNANRSYTVGIDNAQLTWSSGVPTYSSDKPTIYWTNSFSPGTVSSWDSFAAGETTNGGNIYYQLSNDDGATWYYNSGGITWDPAGVGQYNTASEVNNKITHFPTTNNKINVRAFLSSNGSQLVQLDYITIGYSPGSGSNNGTFISSPIDAGNEVSFNRIEWDEINTINTTTQFQVASNNDNTTWSFVGPDGTSSTFFTGEEAPIPLSTVLGRYFKYKIYFSSTTNDLPYVERVSINYTP